ncbi:AAA family ATPase [Bradyrhizobium sediminis]|uniref:AAA family ATPase n=1 Tax=Bradyrhizobium sediminis TaxID=2840469 RepID=A0A975NJ41_9BRAD|nr:AAA family ATPase [Bradyrhizobium sediminis]QWG16127.1 AAA family ATPase [Bradyrhizobium sediminis]
MHSVAAENLESDEPPPIDIDPRPCNVCGQTIDRHIRIDTPEGPEFECDPAELEIQAAATATRLRMELSDPRDRDLARLEIGITSGTEPPAPESLADYGLADGVQDFEPAPVVAAPPLALVTPPAWRGVPLPPMRWLATHRIPAADVTILSGDGGGGKTTVALQCGVAAACGLGDWLGTVCEPGPVIFVSAEEPEHEMRRRLERVARKRGIEPDTIERLHFHFASPENCLLAVARADGTMAPTPLFESLAIAAATIRPVLIIVDSIAATFGGNQNDRTHARTFVSLFRRLAQDVDAAVLLLDHPSLSGITSGTGRGGSMDWQNATRARLHLETVTNDDGTTGRVLEMKKSNYGPAGEKVTLHWEDGCFVMEGSAPAPQLAAAQAGADQRYLECLDAMTAQGRNVCPAPGRGYAPKAFAAMPQANGMTARAFQQAQERLFAAGVIAVVPYGPASKGAKCIARKA